MKVINSFFDVNYIAAIALVAAIGAILGISNLPTFALPSPQNPSTEAIITIDIDGTDYTGLDTAPDNGQVANFDTVTYNIEVSLNDADDTNLNATVTLNDKASWLEVPSDCKTLEGFPGISPDSSIADTTGDGLNDTLFCNLGSHSEGTKLSFKPVAQAVGNNLDMIEASIVPGSDQSTALGNTRGDGPVQTEILAGFGLSVKKTVGGFPPEDEETDPLKNELAYNAQYKPVGSIAPGSPQGKIVQYQFNFAYDNGSEFIEDDGAGAQDFTFVDTWNGIGGHSNDPTVEGDNASGIYSDGIFLLGDITGVAADSCDFVTPNPGATVTCTQANPGEPITIQVDDTPVNQKDLANIKMNFFYDYSVIFAPNGFSTGETYNIDNTITLTGWGGSSPTQLVSQNGQTDTFPNDIEDYLINADNSGPLAWYKSFDDNGVGKSGSRTAVPGEIVETTLNINSIRSFDHVAGICDTLDTASFEFAGHIGAGQRDARTHGGTISFASLDNMVGGVIHERYNPVVFSDAGGSSANVISSATSLNGLDYGVEIMFSDVDYAATGDDHWNASCEDDVNQDGGVEIIAAGGTASPTADWYEDYNDLPGGAADVVRIRVMWDRNYSDILAVDTNGSTTTRMYFSFDLAVKNTVAVGTYLPNTATITDSNHSQLQGNWVSTTEGLNSSGGAWGAVYVNVEDNPSVPLYSFNNVNADRIYVVPASVSIRKFTNPDSLDSLRVGDLANFTITPATNGLGGTSAGTALTITDTLPANTQYVSDTCSTVYAAVPENCSVTVSGSTITWDISGHTIGDSLPSFELTVELLPGITAGVHHNQVSIDSDQDAILEDDTFCDTAVDANGVNDADAIAQCQDAFSSPWEDRSSINVVTESGVNIQKSDDSAIIEPGANWSNNLTYTNLGGSDIGQGQIIDILPYNGDGELDTVNPNSPQRHNTDNPANSNDATNTNNPYNQATFEGVTPSAAAETFEYTDTDIKTVDHRPCHVSNWPNGATVTPGGTNPIDLICQEGLVTNADDTPNLSNAGTGTTNWVATDPNTLSSTDKLTVTAIRASTPAFPAGEAERTLQLTTNVQESHEGDLFCNNFGHNSDIVTLDIISNDVCVEVVTGSISNYVWFDENADGVQDASESGIPNVDIKLLVEDPVNLGTYIPYQIPDPANPGSYIDYMTTTDSDGEYLFENLPSGNYQVMVDDTTLPNGTSQTYDYDNQTPPSLGGTGHDHMSAVTIYGPSNPDTGSGLTTDDYTDVEDNTEQDFGYTPPASLGDYVWHDLSNDGVQDASESGIPNAVVNLLDENGDPVLDGSSNPITTTTDATGFYQFINLTPGDYQTSVDTDTLPANYLQTYDLDEATAGRDHNSGTVTLVAGDNNDTLDFGYLPAASLGNYVWIDVNSNGQIDSSETPIEGVTVNLLDENGNPVLDGSSNPITTTTDATGTYLFTNLYPGTYSTSVDANTIPANLIQVYDLDDGVGATNHMSGNVTLAAGENNLTLDYAYVEPAEISGTVWFDADNGQDIDGSEERTESVVVELLDQNGNVLGLTTTDATGFYQFTDLIPGEYQVRITPPENYLQTYDQDGDQEFIILDIDLEAGQVLGDFDFGLITPEELAETGSPVWLYISAALGIMLTSIVVARKTEK